MSEQSRLKTVSVDEQASSLVNQMLQAIDKVAEPFLNDLAEKHGLSDLELFTIAAKAKSGQAMAALCDMYPQLTPETRVKNLVALVKRTCSQDEQEQLTKLLDTGRRIIRLT